MRLTREQLIECYDCVFADVHSPGFKEGEMKDLIYHSDYQFLQRPKEGWELSLKNKIKEFGLDFDTKYLDGSWKSTITE